MRVCRFQSAGQVSCDCVRIDRSDCGLRSFQPVTLTGGLLGLSQLVDYTSGCVVSTVDATTCSGSKLPTAKQSALAPSLRVAVTPQKNHLRQQLTPRSGREKRACAAPAALFQSEATTDPTGRLRAQVGARRQAAGAAKPRPCRRGQRGRGGPSREGNDRPRGTRRPQRPRGKPAQGGREALQHRTSGKVRYKSTKIGSKDTLCRRLKSAGHNADDCEFLGCHY